MTEVSFFFYYGRHFVEQRNVFLFFHNNNGISIGVRNFTLVLEKTISPFPFSRPLLYIHRGLGKMWIARTIWWSKSSLEESKSRRRQQSHSAVEDSFTSYRIVHEEYSILCEWYFTTIKVPKHLLPVVLINETVTHSNRANRKFHNCYF